MGRVIGRGLVVPAEVYEAEVTAARILEEARAEAAAILDAARAEATAEAEARHREAEESARASLALAYAALERAREEAEREAEPALVALALEVGAKLAGEQLRSDAESLRRLVQDARARLGATSRVSLRHHPLDRDALEPLGLERVADPSMEPGGFLIEGVEGVVDARLEVRLSALREALEASGSEP